MRINVIYTYYTRTRIFAPKFGSQVAITRTFLFLCFTWRLHSARTRASATLKRCLYSSYQVQLGTYEYVYRIKAGLSANT